jgi:hypothetical protein
MGEGAESITATQTDVAGNTSAASAAKAIAVDTVVAAPAINVVASNDVVNDGEAASRLHHHRHRRSGRHGDPEHSSSSTTLAGGNTAVVDAFGNWSVTVTDADVTAMGEGAESITAIQTDVAGNTSAASTPKPITVDTVITAPTINVVASNDVVNDGEAAAGFTITGTGEVGATVTLSLDSTITLAGGNTAVVDAFGNWSVAVTDADVTAMGEGAESITATQTDVAGNTSAASAVKAVTVDTVAPTAVTTAVADMATDSGTSGDFITNDPLVAVSGSFSGTLGSGETIQVSADGTNWVTTGTLGPVDSIWASAADAVALVPGAGILQTRTMDAAGNITLGATQAYTLDTGADPLSISLVVDTGASAIDWETSNGMVAVSGLEGGASWQFSTDAGSNWTTGSGSSLHYSARAPTPQATLSLSRPTSPATPALWRAPPPSSWIAQRRSRQSLGSTTTPVQTLLTASPTMAT